MPVLFVIWMWLALAFVGAVTGAAIGQAVGRLEMGAVVGGLLGPLGWLIVLLLPRPLEWEVRRAMAIRLGLRVVRRDAAWLREVGRDWARVEEDRRVRAGQALPWYARPAATPGPYAGRAATPEEQAQIERAAEDRRREFTVAQARARYEAKRASEEEQEAFRQWRHGHGGR